MCFDLDPVLLNYEYLLSLPEDSRDELIDGRIYNIAAPGFNHQAVLSYLHAEIYNYLKDKDCMVFPSPLNVFFMNGENDDINKCMDVVKPDICVICDQSKFIEQGCKGAPDFIIEIVSPATRAMDYTRKHYLYSYYGVQEYWIVDPMEQSVLVYALDDGIYTKPQLYAFCDKIKVGIFEDLVIDFLQVSLL